MELESVLSQSDGTSVDGTQIEQSFSIPSLSADHVIPFDSLPFEIASFIFEHYIYSSLSRQGPCAPLLLGKICRKWRGIAWSTPSLWARLSIYYQHIMSEMRAELAKEWLSRSGTLPLVIELSSFCDDDSCTCTWASMTPKCEQMLEVLIQFSDRWHSLTLVLPPPSLEGLTLSCSASILYHLSLDGRWYDQSRDFRIPNYVRTSLFSSCSPRIVRMSYLNVDLDWTSVVDLTLESVDVEDMLYVFRTAPNLFKCTLADVCHRRFVTMMEEGLITCPSVESLDISFADGSSPGLFFSAVALPALKHLSYRGHEVLLYMDDLILFLTQSFCTLKSLFVNQSEFEPDTSLINLAPFLSALTDLRICDERYYAGGRHTFYHLLADTNCLPVHLRPVPFLAPGLPYLPCLETFVWEGPAPYAWETLPGLIQPVVADSRDAASRCRPLKAVKITCIMDATDNVPYIPRESLRHLSGYRDVEFKFTARSAGHDEGGLDLWTASVEKPYSDEEED
ncbi:hypothetical protein CVT26_005281 [Gymnopilus dilepis]|uniref:Uncharacterized protein n=1 Tax=Gymnopilus dilepis TaxID=231916 RepID=A0A409YSR7_9AGAR|nr:hypothetical protein CVT26_005281 [Gymnopilus dilepis]